jgi:uncharacterized protein DUF4258
MRQRRLPVFLLLVAVILGIVFYQMYCNAPARRTQERTTVPTETARQKSGSEPPRAGNKSFGTSGEPVFDRKISRIVYSKHARCRMDCRRIDESEIIEIKDEGTVNIRKSDLDGPRDPKFAVEGITHDRQHVRVVFAQTSNSLVVVTCIDLDTDWACSCN